MTVKTTLTFEEKPLDLLKATLRTVSAVIDTLPSTSEHQSKLAEIRDGLRGIQNDLVRAEQRRQQELHMPPRG